MQKRERLNLHSPEFCRRYDGGGGGDDYGYADGYERMSPPRTSPQHVGQAHKVWPVRTVPFWCKDTPKLQVRTGQTYGVDLHSGATILLLLLLLLLTSYLFACNAAALSTSLIYPWLGN